MSWEIQTNDPGKFDGEVSYVSGGMSWQADYNLVVSDKSNSKFDVLDMVGWVTMSNQSGKTFENATIKLLAGDVKQDPGRQRRWTGVCCGQDGGRSLEHGAGGSREIV